MSFLDEIQRDMELGIENDMPKTVIIEGYEFPCSISERSDSSNLIGGGFEPELGLRVIVRLDSVDTAGANKLSEVCDIKKVAYIELDEVEYNVDKVETFYNAFATIYLKDANKR